MISFPFLTDLGCAVALISDRSDEDCGRVEGRPNLDRLLRAAGVDPERLVCGRQVHETAIAEAGERHAGAEPFPATDGIVTGKTGLPVVVFVADCVPVFLYDPVRRAAGVVHAGREGTRREIAKIAVAKMREAFGSDPGNVRAVIGPSAGPCCYEVGAGMADEWRGAGLPAAGRRLDLWTANLRQLTGSGVAASHVMVSGICTICDDRFHSYRRDKTGARNAAIIMI